MHSTGTQRTRELRNPKWHNETPGETPRDGKAQRNRRIEMRGRNIAERINHSRDSQPKGKMNHQDAREIRGIAHHRSCAAAKKDERECANELGSITPEHIFAQYFLTHRFFTCPTYWDRFSKPTTRQATDHYGFTYVYVRDISLRYAVVPGKFVAKGLVCDVTLCFILRAQRTSWNETSYYFRKEIVYD